MRLAEQIAATDHSDDCRSPALSHRDIAEAAIGLVHDAKQARQWNAAAQTSGCIKQPVERAR
jgi:hypothetical protein